MGTRRNAAPGIKYIIVISENMGTNFSVRRNTLRTPYMARVRRDGIFYAVSLYCLLNYTNLSPALVRALRHRICVGCCRSPSSSICFIYAVPCYPRSHLTKLATNAPFPDHRRWVFFKRTAHLDGFVHFNANLLDRMRRFASPKLKHTRTHTHSFVVVLWLIWWTTGLECGPYGAVAGFFNQQKANFGDTDTVAMWIPPLSHQIT